jgi:membrane-bound serine protease (ClpP class)
MLRTMAICGRGGVRRPPGLALLVAVAALAAAPAAAQAGTDTAADVQTVVVPVHGTIDVTTAAIVRRGYAEARARSAARVVLDIDTPGGLVTEMREVETVLAQIRAAGMHTAAFVRRQALSAGAYIALACRDVFVAPGASIGAITPVLADPMGGVTAIPDDDARRKAYAAMRADVRALVEGRGGLRHDVLRAVEAMVDPTLRLFEVRYIDRSGLSVTELMFLENVRLLEAEGLKIESRREFGSQPLVLTAEDALRLGLAKGRAASIEELMRDEYLTTMATTLVLDKTWSESAVEWLDAMKPVLLVLGLLLLLVEMKTPGFIVPGVLGVALLGLAMFGSYLVGLADVTEILLLVLGLVALAVEIFFLPGTIVFGAVGLVCVVAAMILSQQTFVLPSNDSEQALLSNNLLNLLLVTAGVIAAFWGYVRLLPHIPIMNRVLLVPPEPAAVMAPAGGNTAASLYGRIGTAATDLRPSGIVEFADGARYDAVTRGDYVTAGTPVRVLELAYQQLVVEAAAQRERGQVSLGVLFLLTAIGLALIVAEVFFVSMGAFGGLAALSLLSAIVLAFTHHGQLIGFTFLALAAIGAPVVAFLALRALPRTRFGQQLILTGPAADEIAPAAPTELRALVQQSGIAESILRPAGIARVAGRRVDVVTRGELIEAGTPVTVLAVEGSRVVVAASREASSPSDPRTP